jgi:hypothetical protein
MKYLCCIKKPNSKSCGLDLVLVTKVAALVLFLCQLGLLVSLCCFRVGLASYFFSMFKLVGFTCIFISSLRKNFIFGFTGYMIFQLTLWLQFVFVVLLPVMYFTVFKFAPAGIKSGLVIYEAILAVQLFFELVVGYYLFSYINIHFESKSVDSIDIATTSNSLMLTNTS